MTVLKKIILNNVNAKSLKIVVFIIAPVKLITLWPLDIYPFCFAYYHDKAGDDSDNIFSGQ